MTAPDSLPLHALAEDNLAAASPDLLRAMVKTFADALMSAEADALCGAEYGQVSDERVNHRNGYRPREWDTRAGTVELAVPKAGVATTYRTQAGEAGPVQTVNATHRSRMGGLPRPLRTPQALRRHLRPRLRHRLHS
jgi:hypothetical protein